MRRKSLVIVWFASAAITFVGLWLGLGKDHFNRGHHMCRPMMERHCMMREMEDEECAQPEIRKNEKVIVIKEVVKKDSIKK